MNTPRTDSPPSYLDHRYDMGIFQTPKRKAINNDRNLSSTTFTSFEFPELFPYTDNNAPINSLPSSPTGLEEAFIALDEERSDIDQVIAALEQESQQNQEKLSPLPSPKGFSHPIIQNLVSPENLISLITNEQRSSCPRTPSLKKRNLMVNPNQHRKEQNKKQQKRTKNKRISLTVPNLLMGLKYSTSSTQHKKQQIDKQRSSNSNSNSNRGAKTKREEDFALLHHGSLTIRKRKKNSRMNEFPLPSLKKGEDTTDTMNKTMNATYNNNNIIAKKAPSLEIFRRKWDSLSKRKGHICEHKMSKAEQKQLLRESFGKSIIRPPLLASNLEY